MPEKKNIIFWSLIVIVPLVLGLAITQLVLASGRMQEPEPTLAPDQAQIATLQTELQDPRLDAQMKQSLQEKLDMAVLIATNQAIAAAVTPIFALAEATSTPYPTPNLEAGLFEGSDGIIQPSLAAVQNGWQGMLDGNIVQVFAGSEPVDTNQGLIIVIAPGGGQAARTMDVYPAPEPHGWLRIEMVEDGTLKLVSQDGIRYHFDLRKKEYFTTNP
jgi:hypothetical protein